MRKVSEILKDKRLILGLNLNEVSKTTKIPIELIEKIENGRWEGFNSFAYLQGIVKKYANFLEIDQEKALSYLKRDYELKPAHFIRKTDYEESRRQLPSNWYIYVAIFLVVMFFGVQFIIAWQKPLLELNPIPAKLRVSKPLVVEGKTQSGVLLYLNDEQIYQDEEGRFRERLFFKSKGERQIVLKAVGINGKEEIKLYEVEVN